MILNSLLFRFLQFYLNTLGLYVSESCERMFVELISHFTRYSFFIPCSFLPLSLLSIIAYNHDDLLDEAFFTVELHVR